MSHVFISYKRADHSLAMKVNNFLKEKGIETWMDTENLKAGEYWNSVIDTNILNCYALVVVVTEHSMNAEWVMYEWVFALGAEKLIIPLYAPIEDKQERIFNEMLLAKRLNESQRVNFSDSSEKVKLIQTLVEARDKYYSSVPIPAGTPQYIRNIAYRAFGGESNDNQIKEAVTQLAQTDSPYARTILANALNHENSRIRDVTLIYMDECKIYAIEAVDGLMKMASEGIGGANSYKIQRLLVGIGDQVVNPLKKYTTHKDKNVRQMTYMVLGEIATPDSIDTLNEGVADENIHVRQELVRILGSAGAKAGNEKCFDIMINVLKQEAEFNVTHLICETVEKELLGFRSQMDRSYIKRKLDELKGYSFSIEASKTYQKLVERLK